MEHINGLCRIDHLIIFFVVIKNRFVQYNYVNTIAIEQINLKLLLTDFTIIGRGFRRRHEFLAQVLFWHSEKSEYFCP